LQEKEPELEGVVIVCDGGDDVLVKKEITEAVSALFQIETHKIKVMKSKEK
jgi:stage III sporulation protein AG